ncbi:hypothetical protein TCAL_11779 [Tigriopus californicus]|uniref:Glycine cleavage system H protein n=1 Tax=Tigriopus californicus TaxID=6832 RepID=A0A553PGW0_TIGCA|nr:glycine cleavage system H protein-like [Tigriopus californicus]XP_059083276.1 glycine cleavage system H protein-like [Tigriopus californicus]TRY76907.1 hypothetical protein TCAL_11779 [Tigriopus californicus]|eukprot:TCALIF_11779-PA protein Name:"Similar to ppl Glycine cleavage system H protein, mitochondrial (Drosophila melanogaster)" AED:0.05 eAED:0.05 QI:206/1/1/1/0.5/0.33/3/91/180
MSSSTLLCLRTTLSRNSLRLLRPAQIRSSPGSLLLDGHSQIRGLASTSRLLAPQIYFTKKHEWVRVEGEIGTVGISNYAQEALGDVVYAQLPDVDETVSAGDECGALESVKAASEIYTPVSGTISEKNEKVEAAPALINSSAMEDGWLFKVKLSNAESEVKALMAEDAYQAYLKTQEDDH